ncbi:sialidase family protein [Parapedobacter pyrenivorans]|nr:sialidase family protein [Parapedobacter pyrenivorans]
MKKMINPRRICRPLPVLALCLFLNFSLVERTERLPFRVQTEVAHQALNPTFAWFHPRAAAIPGYGEDGKPAVMMTLQKHLKVSDFYSGLYYMRTNDLGKTWTDPIEVPELAWTYEPDGTTVSVADVTPGWHEKTGKLLGIGIKVRYDKAGKQLVNEPRARDAHYTVFDPVENSWTPWRAIAGIPEENGKFFSVNPGCTQWLVKPNGNILLPIYFRGPGGGDYSVTVLECSFDGLTLSYLQHGTEMTVEGGRGLVEPSLAFYDDTYYLTLRNDKAAYVTTSRDGLNWEEFRPWKFDNGEVLGSYNTQAHWLVHSDGLFLSYTRKGADNDHIMRNRAPLFLAQVNPEELHVIRATEQILMSERGVMLGNFGASSITKDESWVTDAEFMIGDEPHPRGANGTLWNARIIWGKENKLVF